MIADERCPECHGHPETRYRLRDRIVKKCLDCGHCWLEEPSAEPLLGQAPKGPQARLRERP